MTMMDQMKIIDLRSTMLIVLLLGMLFIIQVESVGFELASGHTKCIAEEIKANSMTVGKYHILDPSIGSAALEGNPLPESHKITVRVTSTYGNSYHFVEHVVDGHFAFQAVEAGDYMTCFFAADFSPPVTMTVDFEWKSGVSAKDWSNVAKKGSVELMEMELRKMFDYVQSIHDEMFYLRSREEEMQDLNRATNSKMFWLSMLSLFVCLSVAGLQLWHLKSFFQKKKLI
ncbi:vesicle coat protein [Lithospermum erythrorhizon]|uniref:Vesicle coat protein n=1 Tax=Lithospermum erythrorhizon TaxID=34254 RepID=A0AAV3RJL2_LITER